jgi:hypothetical protein
LYWVSGDPGLHPKCSILLLIFFPFPLWVNFFLAEVRRKIFFKNFSFGGKGGLVTFGFSPNVPLQESLVAYKIPSFAGAKMSARAVLSRTFDLIRKIFTHVPSDLALFPKKKKNEESSTADEDTKLTIIKKKKNVRLPKTKPIAISAITLVLFRGLSR